jgi:hypothetical protein
MQRMCRYVMLPMLAPVSTVSTRDANGGHVLPPS